MALDRNPSPFNRQRDPSLGPKAYRTENEPVDERPLVVWGPFWDTPMEQATYEAAVHANPRRPEEGAWSYIARISALVTGEIGSPFHRMPRWGRSQSEWERMQNDVKRRAAGDRED